LRWLALVAGVALVIVAFVAASRVEDTRQGLVAEVVTLLGGVASIGLLMYAWMARPRPGPPSGPPSAAGGGVGARPRSTRDLLLGLGGVALAAVLLAGLALSGGLLWAAFGFALLLPMLAGCVYLCVRFLRSAP
jgi:hypothetical protein